MFQNVTTFLSIENCEQNHLAHSKELCEINVAGKITIIHQKKWRSIESHTPWNTLLFSCRLPFWQF